MTKNINQQRDYNVNQMSLLLEIPFSEKQIEKTDICFTVLNIVERVNLEKYIEFSKGKPTSYDIERMFTAVLLAFAEHGYAELRKIETLIKYDLRYRLIMQQRTPSYRTIGRFINDYLKIPSNRYIMISCWLSRIEKRLKKQFYISMGQSLKPTQTR